MNYGYIDFHCDTLLLNNFPQTGESLFHNTKSVDFVRMEKALCTCQFFAIFLPTPNYFKKNQLPVPNDWEYVAMQTDAFYGDIEEHSLMIRSVQCWQDYQNNLSDRKMSAILTIEDGRLLDNCPANVLRLKNMGIRLLTLTWNNPNCLGFPHSETPSLMEKGLTDFGKEVLPLLNDNGILIDVSHLSDGGFWDVIHMSKRPVIASHSNARALCHHSRNLSDRMIRAIAANGGCVGVSFSPEMVSSHTGSSLVGIAAHLRHMISVGGIDCPVIGTDFDGIHGNLEIPECSSMGKLWGYLLENGFTHNEVEHISRKNGERIIHEVIG